MSNSLQPHGLQHAWLLCTSLSPGVCSSSFPYPGLKTHSQSCSLGLGFTVSLSPQRMTFCHSYPYSKTLQVIPLSTVNYDQGINNNVSIIQLTVRLKISRLSIFPNFGLMTHRPMQCLNTRLLLLGEKIQRYIN